MSNETNFCIILHSSATPPFFHPCWSVWACSRRPGRDKVFVCEFSLAGPSLNSPETVEFAEWLVSCLRFEVWLPASFNNRLSELGAVATAFYSLIIHTLIISYTSLYHGISGLNSTTIPPGMLSVSYRFLSTYT